MCLNPCINIVKLFIYSIVNYMTLDITCVKGSYVFTHYNTSIRNDTHFSSQNKIDIEEELLNQNWTNDLTTVQKKRSIIIVGCVEMW